MPGAIDFSRRRSAVLAALAGIGADGLLVTAPANVRYLCGFTGSSGWLLLRPEDTVFLTDPRYREQAGREVVGARVEISTTGLVAALRSCVERADRRLAFEAEHVSVATRDKLAAVHAEWLPHKELVESERRRKDAAEVAAVRAALALAEAALREVAASLVAGQTETEVAAALEHACRRRGAARMAFDTIVAAGPRSALPHGVASDRPIGAGEPVMIDMGCVLDGYCSDITRMVWVGGAPSGEFLQLHATVDAARRAAIDEVCDGASCRAVDAVARAVIDDAGHADGFVHGTGHGVGLEIHEAPALSSRSKDRLEAGMIVTIEPAIYMPGAYGVRIEDMIVVTDAGHDRLTTLDAEPILPDVP